MVIADSEDFVGEFLLIPVIVFETRPDDFGDARLFGKDEGVAMMGGFESCETERFGNGTHDENIGNGVNVTETFATNKTSKDDVLTDAEVSSEFY